jgi:Tfp pilus assembly protein FimT
VVLVLALLVGVAIPTLSSVTGAKARSELSGLAANLRAVRGHAAVTGQTCRMVLCLGDCVASGGERAMEDGSYLVECTKGEIPVAKESVRNGRREEDTRKEEALSESEKLKAELKNRVRFASSEALPAQRLEKLGLESVWTPHQPEKYTKGTASIYFYPSGSSERALLQVKDGEDWYALKVSSLSGKVAVVEGKEEPPRELEEEDD